MSTDRPNYVALLMNMAPGLAGALLGGAVSWGVAQQKMDDFERRIGANELRTAAIEKQQNDDRVYLAGELGQIKAKLDSLNSVK